MKKYEIDEAKKKLDAYKDKVKEIKKIAESSREKYEESLPDGRIFGPYNEFRLKQVEKEIKDSEG